MKAVKSEIRRGRKDAFTAVALLAQYIRYGILRLYGTYVPWSPITSTQHVS